ncbi:uncharacterized protein LOC135143657 isoform X1 [Zophobas morio]|uniref:uncharacterized protein LOC135143657 isoform X1 n=1 Tax=Zophobas morio TaxID=2755281 RepID=UPI00308393BF
MSTLSYYNISESSSWGKGNEGTLHCSEDKIVYQDLKGDKRKVESLINKIANVQYRICAKGYELRLHFKDDSHISFFGFQDEGEILSIVNFIKRRTPIEVSEIKTTTNGFNWGDLEIRGDYVFFNHEGENVFDFPINSVERVNISKKQDISIQFKDSSENIEGETLCEVRFTFPKPTSEVSEAANDFESPTLTLAEKFHANLTSRCDFKSETSPLIVAFPEVHFLVPRGRHDFRLYKDCFQLHGKSSSYTVEYSNILRYFLLPRDSDSILFVICLNQPLRKGQKLHSFLVLVIPTTERIEADLNLSKEDLVAPYGDSLQEHMDGATYEVLTKIIKNLSQKKVLTPFPDFTNDEGFPLVKCSFKAEVGVIFPLKSGLIFVHQPVIYIRDSDISHIRFERVGTGGSMIVVSKSGEEYSFNISQEKGHYDLMLKHMHNKPVKCVVSDTVRPMSFDEDNDEQDPYNFPLNRSGLQSESEEDEDFVAEPSSTEDDDSDSNFNESSGGVSHSDSESGPVMSELQETPVKPSKRHGESPRRALPSKKKRQKAIKDPLAPKKPPSAFLLHNLDKRRELLGKGLKPPQIIQKLAEMWKASSPETKSKYEKLYLEKKKEYEKQLAAYQRDRRPEEGRSFGVNENIGEQTD